MKEQYVVTLRGKNVWSQCALVCIIDNIRDSMLDTVASYIQTQFDMQVNDFKRNFGELSATTSRKDVVVCIERTSVLNNTNSDKPF